MDNLRYSIIYAAIRPEISEQISVGLIILNGDELDIRYSSHKLKALQSLFPEKEYRFITNVISNMKKNGTVNTEADVNYLTRYSNNLITFSPLKSIDVPPTTQNKDWLFRNYVYNGK
ncbi:MAG: hypothetical protein K6E86_00225 [Bacteroidales bacterium]|nr:hypothetical protein [Bacteroidales bacterium]